jgi:D-alanyl-D-alanine carboxypeptidase/D-alanyl-D-alanine-endopeptidase (penicillin-binding protein 4)
MPAGSVTAIRVLRDEAGGSITVRGEIAADDPGLTRTVAVRNPALYLASVLRETLRENGIAVEGPAVHYSAIGISDPALRNPMPLFIYQSPALSEILAGMMKPSQNQIAETLLRTVGRELRGEGTAEGGVLVVDSLLASWQLEPRELNLADGSGLSRYNLLSPALLVELLTYMDRSRHRDVWLASLPEAGWDGTLEYRMREPPLSRSVLAKTGSLGGVRALSGYLTARSGERFVFATIINNSLLEASTADDAVEAALAAVASSR